jgi:hypothetical protein
MADLNLSDVRRFAIEQEASILMKSPSHERAAEVSRHGIIQWVRTAQEADQEWLLTPVDIRFEEILANAEEFVIQRPQTKALICNRERFTSLLAPKVGAPASSTHGEEE